MALVAALLLVSCVGQIPVTASLLAVVRVYTAYLAAYLDPPAVLVGHLAVAYHRMPVAAASAPAASALVASDQTVAP